MDANSYLQDISAKIKNGETVSRITVRELVQKFGQRRRGIYVVSKIRNMLEEFELTTHPDFENIYIDAEISFSLNKLQTDKKSAYKSNEPNTANEELVFKVGLLSSANKEPLSVAPNMTIKEAVTLMLTHDYSQLLVTNNGPYNVQGVISWASIGKGLALGKTDKEVKSYIVPEKSVDHSDPLLNALRDIIENDFVIIKKKKKVCGIVTTSDLSSQFKDLTEPFLLLTEIENQLRHLIKERCGLNPTDIGKLVSDESANETVSVNNLTFGNYCKIFANEAFWTQLKVQIDQKQFSFQLNEIRKMRNDVMHFNADPLDAEMLEQLRCFSRLVETTRTAPQIE